MKNEQGVAHNKGLHGFGGCILGQQHYRELECLENFAGTIGLDLKTAIKMGFIKDIIENEKELKHE